jgi:hypothetical protein
MVAALILATVPADAFEAVIEIRVPVGQPAGEDQIQAALLVAVARTVQGAEAMGLPAIHLISAEIKEQAVVLRVLAVDRQLAASPDGSGPDVSPRVAPVGR